MEIVRLLFYGQEERVCGQVHLTGQASAWKGPGITFLGTQERAQEPALRGQSDTQHGLGLFLIVS